MNIKTEEEKREARESMLLKLTTEDRQAIKQALRSHGDEWKAQCREAYQEMALDLYQAVGGDMAHTMLNNLESMDKTKWASNDPKSVVNSKIYLPLGSSPKEAIFNIMIARHLMSGGIDKGRYWNGDLQLEYAQYGLGGESRLVVVDKDYKNERAAKLEAVNQACDSFNKRYR